MSDQEIIEKLRLGALSEEAKVEALNAVNQEVETRLAGVIDDSLSDEQRLTFDQMLEQTPEKVFAWLSEQTTDLGQLYEAALQDYIDEVNVKVDQVT